MSSNQLRQRKPNSTTISTANDTLNAIQQQISKSQANLNESPYKFENFRSILKFPFLLVTSRYIIHLYLL